MALLVMLLVTLLVAAALMGAVAVGAIAVSSLQRRQRYAGLESGQPALLEGRTVLARLHHDGVPNPGRSPAPSLIVTGAWWEIRLDGVLADDSHQGSDRDIATLWLREPLAALKPRQIEGWLEGDALIVTAPGRLAERGRFQERALSELIGIADALQAQSAVPGGLVDWAGKHRDPAVRLIAAQRTGQPALFEGVVEDPAARRHTWAAALRGLPRAVSGRLELEALYRFWLIQNEPWLVERGVAAAATLDDALSTELVGAIERLLEAARASVGPPSRALLATLWEATPMLKAEQQGLLVALLLMGEAPLSGHAARRLGEVGDVGIVPALTAAMERYGGGSLLWDEASRGAANAAREAISTIQGRLTHAEAGALTLTDGGGEAGGLALADGSEGALSITESSEA